MARQSVAIVLTLALAGVGCPEDDLTCEENANCPDSDICLDGVCVFRSDAIAYGPSCPEGCVGDLVRDFDFQQGGKTGVWRFLDDGRDNTWSEMFLGDLNGVTYFAGLTPDPRPLTLYCPAYTEEAACVGVENRMVLTPSLPATGHRDVVIAFDAPRDGTYQLVGDYVKKGEGTLDVFIRRNVRDDVIRTFSVGAQNATGDIDETIELLAGDRLHFTVRSTSEGTPASLGVHLFVVDKVEFPGACDLALRFEEQKAVDACGAVVYTARTGDGEGGYTDTTLFPVDGALPETGNGLHIGVDDYLLPEGLAMNYAADFTVQMWVKVPAFTFSTLYADWDDAVAGGINISSGSGGSFSATGLYQGPVEVDAVDVSWQWPDDWDWHFLRVTRDAAAGTFRACLDGSVVAGTTLDAAHDLSGAVPPFIGRNVTYNPPYFLGDIDDVRVYRRTLPCGQ